MGLFSNINKKLKFQEMEILLNQIMKDTYAWEKSKNMQTIMTAATSIKTRFAKVVSLYYELIRLQGHRDMNFTNSTLPYPMPNQMPVLDAIVLIVQLADDIGKANFSFKNNLIDKETTILIEEILYFN